MKDEALAIIRNLVDPSQKLNRLREYIQLLTLWSLHESEAFAALAFVGGTALRIVFSLPRFSEDMDFSLEKTPDYKPERWMKKLKNDLVLAGFDASVSWNDRTTVHKAWIKVAGLLQEAGLATMPNQKLSIKMEIDTRPPAGAVCARTIITRDRMLALQHYDLRSLMAGKIHALITRRYPKGRDWYDLLWYTGLRPAVEPNLPQLQNALDQTQGKGTHDASQWRDDLIAKIGTHDDRKLKADVQPFLEHPDEALLLTTKTIRSVLAG